MGHVINDCERYNVSGNYWETIQPVKIKRFAACAVSMHEKKKIYLFGGRSSEENSLVSEIEYYSVLKNKWKII